MLVAAVHAIADQSPALKDDTAALLPDVSDVREISVKIAAAVIKSAVKNGLAQEKDIPQDDGAWGNGLENRCGTRSIDR